MLLSSVLILFIIVEAVGLCAQYSRMSVLRAKYHQLYRERDQKSTEVDSLDKIHKGLVASINVDKEAMRSLEKTARDKDEEITRIGEDRARLSTLLDNLTIQKDGLLRRNMALRDSLERLTPTLVLPPDSTAKIERDTTNAGERREIEIRSKIVSSGSVSHADAITYQRTLVELYKHYQLNKYEFELFTRGTYHISIVYYGYLDANGIPRRRLSSARLMHDKMQQRMLTSENEHQ